MVPQGNYLPQLFNKDCLQKDDTYFESWVPASHEKILTSKIYTFAHERVHITSHLPSSEMD